MHWLHAENGFVHVCGHRGHIVGAPENTMAAFAAAHDRGATTCETDVVLLSDGEIMVIHDLTLDRTTTGQGFVGRASAAEIAQLDAGGWFDTRFAGERVVTLSALIEYAKSIGMGLEVEVKEHLQPDRLIDRLAEVLAATDGLDDIILISFDHTVMRTAKQRIPGLKTEGIIHARHGDPVGVARAAELDALSIEVGMFHADDARALHAAGIAIRCHVPRPDRIAKWRDYGVDIEPTVGAWLADGLIDSLSGDDVGYLKGLVDRYAPGA